MIKSICIVRLSALGDVLMLVPLVRTLQQGFPGVAITWVISRPAYDLVEGMEGVEFIVLDKPDGLKDYWRFKQKMKDKRFDVLLAAQASFRANLLYPSIKAKRKIGYDKVRAKDGHGWFIHECIAPAQNHTLEGFLQFAQVLGLEQPVIQWNLPIQAEDRLWAKNHLPEGDILIINPAASKPERSWPVERTIEVIQQAQQRWGMQVVLTGGPGAFDRELANCILQAVDVTCLVGQTKPKQLLAVIEQARLVLCPDTGPSHMAAAVGTPVIALQAVTSAEVSGPYTFRHLAIDHYYQAFEQAFNKPWDPREWGRHVHGSNAMKLISVAEVLQRMQDLLGT